MAWRHTFPKELQAEAERQGLGVMLVAFITPNGGRVESYGMAGPSQIEAGRAAIAALGRKPRVPKPKKKLGCGKHRGNPRTYCADCGV